jgi:hypothetical protein
MTLSGTVAITISDQEDINSRAYNNPRRDDEDCDDISMDSMDSGHSRRHPDSHSYW